VSQPNRQEITVQKSTSIYLIAAPHLARDAGFIWRFWRNHNEENRLSAGKIIIKRYIDNE
jgi:hypothetical protein